MHPKKWLLLSVTLIAAAPVFAGSGVSAPRLGAIRLADGSVRHLYGFTSNFILGDAIATEAVACTFSNGLGLILSNGKLRLLAADGHEIGSYETNERNAVLSIGDSETTALAYLASSGVLLKWNNKEFAQFPVSLPGRIVSMDSELRSAAGSLRGSVRSTPCTEPGLSGSGCDETRQESVYLIFQDTDSRNYRATVSMKTGDVLLTEPLPGTLGPAAVLEDNVIFYDKQSLHVQFANGLIRALGINEQNPTFEKIADDWLHIASKQTGRHWALHLTNCSAELSELPTLPAPTGAKQ